MTTTRFGAPAPITRAYRFSRAEYAGGGAIAFRANRLVRLTFTFDSGNA